MIPLKAFSSSSNFIFIIILLLLATTVFTSAQQPTSKKSTNKETTQGVFVYLYSTSPDCDGVFEKAEYDVKECSNTRHDTSAEYFCQKVNYSDPKNANKTGSYEVVIRTFPYSLGCNYSDYSEENIFPVEKCYPNSRTTSYKFTCSAGRILGFENLFVVMIFVAVLMLFCV